MLNGTSKIMWPQGKRFAFTIIDDTDRSNVENIGPVYDFLYENGFIPRRGMSDVRAWLKILDQVESLDVLSYVPGEGPPGDKIDFEDFRQFLEWCDQPGGH